MIGVLVVAIGLSVVAFVVVSVRLCVREESEQVEATNERDNYNENMRSAAFWVGADKYTDYDGNRKEI